MVAAIFMTLRRAEGKGGAARFEAVSAAVPAWDGCAANLYGLMDLDRVDVEAIVFQIGDEGSHMPLVARFAFDIDEGVLGR